MLGTIQIVVHLILLRTALLHAHIHIRLYTVDAFK